MKSITIKGARYTTKFIDLFRNGKSIKRARFEACEFTPQDVLRIVSAFQLVEKVDFFDCNFGDAHFKALQLALKHNNVVRTFWTDEIPVWLHLPNVLHLQCRFENYSECQAFMSQNTWCITINFLYNKRETDGVFATTHLFPLMMINHVKTKDKSLVLAYRAMYATVMHVLCIGKYRRRGTPWRDLMPLIARHLYRMRGDTIWLALGERMHKEAWQLAFKKRK